MRKATLIGMSALVVTSLSFGTAAIASAATTGSTTQNTTHQSKHGDADDRRVRLHARLNQAVRDGTITTAQKTTFLHEYQSLRQQLHASLKSAITTTQRQADRQQFRSSLEAWASSNNFPLNKIFPKL